MASKIILKKSSVAAKAPVAGDLDFGELAINYTDSKLYFKKADGSIDAFSSAAASAPVTSVGGNIGAVTDAQLLASIKNVDGTGSGLDADFLDGLNASAFYLASNPNGYTSNTGTVTSVDATAPLVSSGGTAPSISIPAANSTTNGYMSSAYASKLDGIAAGATANTGTVTSVSGTGSASGLSLSGTVTTSGSLTLSGTVNSVSASSDQAIVNQHNGNSSVWYGRILSKNSTNDRAAFLGTYGGIAGVFAHNDALNAWADLYINTVDGSGGGTVRLPSSVLINGSQAIHAGNYTSYSPSLTGSGASGTWGINITGNAATASNSSQLNGLSSIQLFNNMGGVHGTQTDFNAISDFGVRYVQGTTNGPGTGSQYYGFTIGLGNDYAYSSYASQLYWPRTPLSGSPYLSVRFRENGGWGSWSKIYAGYADTAGNGGVTSVNGQTGAVTVGSFPSGTVMLFAQTAAPTGWTKQTTHDNKALRVVSGTAGSGGSVAFTTAFASKTPSGSVSVSVSAGTLAVGIGTLATASASVSGSVGATTLSTNEIPSHNHRQSIGTVNVFGTEGSGYRGNYGGAGNGSFDLAESRGGGGSHSHSFSGGSHSHTMSGSPSLSGSPSVTSASFTGTAIDLSVQYVDVILASKD